MLNLQHNRIVLEYPLDRMQNTYKNWISLASCDGALHLKSTDDFSELLL